jgi:hypothetical protein
MGLFRLLVTGAAVAAGVHYITKKRPDGTSVVDDLKARAPEWKEKAQPYVDQLKDKWTQMQGKTGNSGTSGSSAYPNSYDNFSPDPDPSYTS